MTRLGGKATNDLGGNSSAWREPVQPGDARSRGRSRRRGVPHHRCPRGAVLRRAGRRSRGAHPHRPGRPHRRPRRGADLRELGPEVDVLDPARRRTLVALAPHPVRELPRPRRGQARRRGARQVARRCRRRRRARAVHGRPQRPADVLHRPEEGRDGARPVDRDHVRLHQGRLQLPLQGGQGRLPHLHLAVRRGRHGRGPAPAERRGDRQRRQRRPHAGRAHARRRPGRSRGHPVQRRLRDRQPVPLDGDEGGHRHRRGADRRREDGHVRRAVHHHRRRRLPRLRPHLAHRRRRRPDLGRRRPGRHRGRLGRQRPVAALLRRHGHAHRQPLPRQRHRQDLGAVRLDVRRHQRHPAARHLGQRLAARGRRHAPGRAQRHLRLLHDDRRPGADPHPADRQRGRRPAGHA